MTSFLDHIQLNIDPKNIKFYKDLMDLLKWTAIMETESFAGFRSSEAHGEIWYIPAKTNEAFDYDKRGMNHVGIGVGSVEEVDTIVDWLVKNNIKSLFGTPTHRPEYAASENDTYYQVMFESPDRILFEVVYKGKK